MTIISITDYSVQPSQQYQFFITKIKACEFSNNVNLPIPSVVREEIDHTLNQDRLYPFELKHLVLTSIGPPDNSFLSQLTFKRYR